MNHATPLAAIPMLSLLTPAALEALYTAEFSAADDYGHFPAPPENRSDRDALNAFLAGHLAQSSADEGDSLLNGFEFANTGNASAFESLLATVRAARPTDEIIFNTSSVGTRDNLATKDKKPLNVLKLTETAQNIPYGAIRATPGNNPRQKTSRKGLHALALSIIKSGQRHDIAVRPHQAEPGAYSIIYGYRRHAAIGYAIEQGWAKLSYEVGTRVIDANDAQARLLAIAENDGREIVDPLDEAESYAVLMASVTLETLAKQTGLEPRELKGRAQLAFNLSDKSKAGYRRGDFDFETLKALSGGTIARQDEFLASANEQQLSRPGLVLSAMTRTDFNLSSALFTLEEYRASGGEVEENLFFPDSSRLLSLEVIDALQRQKLTDMSNDFTQQGYGEVIVLDGETKQQREEFARGSMTTPLERRAVVMTLNSDLSVTVDKDLVRLEAEVPEPVKAPWAPSTPTAGSTTTSGSTTSGNTPPVNIPPEARFTDSASALIRTIRTAALHNGLLQSGNPQLWLSLVSYALLSGNDTLLKRAPGNERDKITSPKLTDAMTIWAARLPGVTWSATRGLIGSKLSGMELLETLVSLPIEDLQTLLGVILTSSIADWNVTPSGNSRTGNIQADPLASVIANLLGVSGAEGWTPTPEYYQSVTYYKGALEPHVEAAFGQANTKKILESTKSEIVADILKDPSKLAGFQPPELCYPDVGVRLEPHVPVAPVAPISATPQLEQINYQNFEADFGDSIAAD